MTYASDSFALRAYRACVGLVLPQRFREQFGADMVAVFAELERERRRTSGRGGGLRALAAELPGLIRLAIRERRAERVKQFHHISRERKEHMLESIAQDLRFAGRSLRRAPGFVLIALSTLALGVGANTAIFSVVNSVLLTPPRLRDPDRVMAVGEASRSGGPTQVAVTSPASFFDWQSNLTTIRLAGLTGVQGTLTGVGEPQQLFGVALAVAGGAIGLLVGKWFLELLLAAQATTDLPRAEEIALDGRVLAFTMGVSLLAGVMFGGIPAWQLARARSSDSLRDGARGSSGTQWARSALVVSELALAMVLLVGAGLLLRSFSRLQQVDPGVANTNVLTFRVALRDSNRTFFPTTIEQIRALPSVRSAALVSQLPVSGRGSGAWMNRIDKPLPPGVQPTGEAYRVVTPEYFATVGLPLKSGRALSTQDRRESPGVVVNEALAKKYYPNENPLGKEIYLGAPDNRLFDHAPIVGVVGDTRDMGLGAMLLTRFLGSLLFGVTPTDPVTFAGVAAVLMAAAALASYLPARRATRVDPIVALRAE